MLEKCWELVHPPNANGHGQFSPVNSYMKYRLSTWDVLTKALDFKAVAADKKDRHAFFPKAFSGGRLTMKQIMLCVGSAKCGGKNKAEREIIFSMHWTINSILEEGLADRMILKEKSWRERVRSPCGRRLFWAEAAASAFLRQGNAWYGSGRTRPVCLAWGEEK